MGRGPKMCAFRTAQEGGRGLVGGFTAFWCRQVPIGKVCRIPLATCEAAILPANFGIRPSLVTVRCAALRCVA